MKNTVYFFIILTLFSCLVISCTKPTEACFTFSPATITADSTVIFNASCSDNASYFTWNFGDNTSDTTTTSLTITHKFSSKGQFTVTLNAKRKDGMSSGKEKTKVTQIITVQ